MNYVRSEDWFEVPDDARFFRKSQIFDGQSVVARVAPIKEGMLGCQWVGIREDLEHTIWVCNHIISVGSPSPREQAAMLESAYIRYRRCFAGGRRVSLSRKDLLGLGQNTVDRHDKVKAIADQYVAHAVNEREQFLPLAYYSYESGLLGYELFVLRAVNRGAQEAVELKAVAEIVSDKLVGPKVSEAAEDFAKSLEKQPISSIARWPQMAHPLSR